AEPNHTTLDVQLIGCKSTIKAVERLLSSFDIAFKNVIAYLYTQADTSNIIQTQLDNNTSHRDKLFEAFWFIAEFFERNKDKEEIESLWTSGPEKIKTMSKQILDEFQQLDGKYEARTQGGEQLSQASKAFLATVVRCHAYGCAFDFLTICEGLAELDELLANNSFTLSDLYQHHSQAFLAVLTAMNRPQKLRDWTHKFIDTLLPSIKRYWDNI
ncbi:MAG TPA: hypothetical protein VFN35_22580, partial [Ktedonobacteraceae bacterium]|nr:hypothetical protein [Ktedonobacteraceae bacterium]